MKQVIWGVAIIVLLVVQLALGDSFPIAPDLVLIYLSIGLIFLSLKQVLALGIFSGALLDYFSGLPDGLLLISTIIGLYFAYYLGQLFFQEKLTDFLVVLYVVFTTIFSGLSLLLINDIVSLFGFSSHLDWNTFLGRQLGFHVILNLIFIYPVYWYYNLQIKIQNRIIKKNDTV